MMEKAAAGVRRALRYCLAVQQEETLLIITDEKLLDLGELFFRESLAMSLNATLMTMKNLAMDGTEPPKYIARAMKEVDVVVLVTSRSISHTRARQNASISGTRIASMPGLTKEMLERPMIVDYEAMGDLSRKIAKKLNESSEVRITTEAGTDLTLSIKGREALADVGVYTEPGAFGNLPAGEAFVPPVEGTANGTLVVDGAMAAIGKLATPLTLTIEAGKATKVQGGEEAERLKEILENADKNATNIAEFGIGTNPKAELTGNVLEDEKVLGTIHIALGDNINFGGYVESSCHLDGIVNAPTVYLDGIKWMDKGSITC